MLSHPRVVPNFIYWWDNTTWCWRRKKINKYIFAVSLCCVYCSLVCISLKSGGSLIVSNIAKQHIKEKGIRYDDLKNCLQVRLNTSDIFFSFFRLNWKELLLQRRSSLKWQKLKHFASSPIVTAIKCINFVKCPMFCFFLCFKAVYTYEQLLSHAFKITYSCFISWVVQLHLFAMPHLTL